jgi:hypothetical protein
MEEAFFADDSKFEALGIAEDELIDAYIRNELSPEEQEQFKSNLLKSPRIRERVNFARVLAKKANSVLPPQTAEPIEPAVTFRAPTTNPRTRRWGGFFSQRPAWGMATAAGTLLILVASFLLVSGWLHDRNESRRLAGVREVQRQKEELDKQSREQQSKREQEDAERRREQLAQEQKRLEDLKRAQNQNEAGQRSALGAVVPFLLTQGSSRGSGGGHDLVIGPQHLTAKIQLILDRNDYARYAVTIETADGQPVITKSDLKAKENSLILMVPTKRLPRNDYLVTVNGFNASGTPEPAATYQFRVLKKK